MSTFRRRLMMMAMSNNLIKPSNENLVTWEHLRTIIPKGVFIRRTNGECKLYTNYRVLEPLTWRQIYEIVPEGMRLVVDDNDDVILQYDTEYTPNRHPDSLVVLSDLRWVVPGGVYFEQTDEGLFVKHNTDYVETEDLMKYANVIDLYRCIPHGVRLRYEDGELFVDQVLDNIYHVDINDVSECESMPKLYYDVDTSAFVTMRELFEILPSGVSIINSDDGVQMVYDNETDYNDSTPLVFAELFEILPQGKKFVATTTDYNWKIEVVDSDLVVDDFTANVTWGDFRSIFPREIKVVKMSDGSYIVKYDVTSFDKFENDNALVTRKALSEYIPFGVKLSIDDEGKLSIINTLSTPISMEDFKKPITQEFLSSLIVEGVHIEAAEYTGKLSFVQD